MSAAGQPAGRTLVEAPSRLTMVASRNLTACARAGWRRAPFMSQGACRRAHTHAQTFAYDPCGPVCEIVSIRRNSRKRSTQRAPATQRRSAHGSHLCVAGVHTDRIRHLRRVVRAAMVALAWRLLTQPDR
jgi:hypothetical protein